MLEQLPSNVRDTLSQFEIFDCRDATDPLGKWDVPITGGYNGLRGTIHVEPKMDIVFGDDENIRYTETPSYFGVPQLIGMIITNYVCIERHHHTYENKVLDIDASKLIEVFELYNQKLNASSCKIQINAADKERVYHHGNISGLNELFGVPEEDDGDEDDGDEDDGDRYANSVFGETSEGRGEVFDNTPREIFSTSQSSGGNHNE
jgi:hypothetical protein